MVLEAFAPVGGLDEIQRDLLRDLAHVLYGIDLDAITQGVPLRVTELDAETRLHVAHLLVVLEFMEHPLRPAVADQVMTFADRLDVPLGILRDSRRFAREHFAAVYLDLQR